jgi:hypothetical protein
VVGRVLGAPQVRVDAPEGELAELADLDESRLPPRHLDAGQEPGHGPLPVARLEEERALPVGGPRLERRGHRVEGRDGAAPAIVAREAGARRQRLRRQVGELRRRPVAEGDPPLLQQEVHPGDVVRADRDVERAEQRLAPARRLGRGEELAEPAARGAVLALLVEGLADVVDGAGVVHGGAELGHLDGVVEADERPVPVLEEELHLPLREAPLGALRLALVGARVLLLDEADLALQRLVLAGEVGLVRRGGGDRGRGGEEEGGAPPEARAHRAPPAGAAAGRAWLRSSFLTSTS